MRFERENRYIVLKITDLISAGLTDDEDQALASRDVIYGVKNES